MPVKETSVQYQSSDGRKFDNQAEAERHDELIVALQAYNDARKRFNAAIVKTQKTADGELFDSGVFRDYYYIWKPYNTAPHIETITFIGWYFEVREHDDVVCIISQPGVSTQLEHSKSYPIHELYRSKRKAMTALFQAQKDWLKERGEHIEADEATWYEKNPR